MIFHRTILFLKRKWLESLILFMLLFFLFASFFAGIIMYDSTAMYRDQALSQIGAALQVSLVTESGPAKSDAVSPETISIIQSLPHVLGVDVAPPSLSGSCIPLNLETVKTHSGFDPEKQTSSMFTDEETKIEMDCIALIGCSAIPLRNQFRNQLSVLSEGTFPTNDNRGVLVSSRFAELNSLKINDTIRLKYIYSDQERTATDVKVVGIYDTSLKFEVLRDNDMGAAVYKCSPYNAVFADFDTAAQILEQSNSVYSFKVYVDSVRNLNDVQSQIKRLPLKWTRYQIFNETLFYYREYASQIDIVFSNSLKLIVLTSVFGLIFFGVVFSFWNKSRIRDIGVFEALGESKRRIITQYWMETLLLSIAASIIAIPFSFCLLQMLSKTFAPEFVSSNSSYMAVPYYTGEYDVNPVFSVCMNAHSYALVLPFILFVTAISVITIVRLMRKNSIQKILRSVE